MRKALLVLVVATLAGCGGGSDPPAIALDTNVLSFSATEGGADPASQQVTLTNSGTGTISWTASNDKPWLQVWPQSGTTISEEDTLTISVIITQTEAWLGAISTSGAPPPRKEHAAIWTGAEMIVWGGWDGTSQLNTGARYDPVTDSWLGETSTTDAPSARVMHSVVWTGEEMIVWGGRVPGAVLNTGARYDPVRDEWVAPTSTAAAPEIRAQHSAVWTGAEMIVWGGTPKTDNSTMINTGGRYDPQTDTWLAAGTSTTNAPQARHRHSATWTGSEMIVWGGWNNSTYLNNGKPYDPLTDSWGAATAASGALSARQAHTAVWTGEDMILWGGHAGGGALNSGNRYDPVAESWLGAITTVGALARGFHSAVWTGTEMIIWAGWDGAVSTNDGARYRPPISLAADAYSATITVSDPDVPNSPQVIYVDLTVAPP